MKNTKTSPDQSVLETKDKSKSKTVTPVTMPGVTTSAGATTNRRSWPLVITMVALVIIALMLGLAWHRRVRQRQMVVLDAATQQEASDSASNIAAEEFWGNHESQVDVFPVWHKLTAESTGPVDEQTLAFTLEGERVTRLRAGSEYYLVDRDAYEHFIPHDRNDLVKLQLPDTTLRPLGPTASFVELAASWYVPADIEGELHHRVH